MNFGSVATPPGLRVCALVYVLTCKRFYAPKEPQADAYFMAYLFTKAPSLTAYESNNVKLKCTVEGKFQV